MSHNRSMDRSQSAGSRGARDGKARRSGRIRAAVAGSVAAVFFVPMAVVAAGSSGAGAAPSNDNTQGVLKYGFDINNDVLEQLRPGHVGTTTAATPCMSNIYQSVTAPGQTAISGGVAQSWTVSNNSSTVTLHIRPNMVFSNGQPVTATDVEDSLTHVRMSPLRCSLSAIQTMTATNPDTLVIQLNRPTAGDFLWAMTYIDGMVYPASSIADGIDQARSAPGRSC